MRERRSMILLRLPAAASTWDAMFGLGSQTLDKAVTVKLTRTLAIIPITLALAFLRARKEKNGKGTKVSMKSIFPFFILYFVGASVITTIFQLMISSGIITGMAAAAILGFFSLMKQVSKFFIVMAMAAIGLNTDIVKLVKSGGKPIAMGLCCWVGISLTQSRNAAYYGNLVALRIQADTKGTGRRQSESLPASGPLLSYFSVNQEKRRIFSFLNNGCLQRENVCIFFQ